MYTLPRASIAKPPKLLLVSERDPKTPRVEEAYVVLILVVEALPKVVFPTTESAPAMVVLPVFEIVKSVVVAVPCDDEPIAKSVVETLPVVDAAWIES